MNKNKSSTCKSKQGDKIFGYIVKKTNRLIDIDADFLELEHVKTKAKHIHIQNKDKENTFAVAFKTIPYDSTGVAHILEHTVLCGSKKFPVRDPFFSMLKRSLNTFMNAFTSSDWTMYPFATPNQSDYLNLMDVYLDATFFPKLDNLSFKQEGHRLEFDNKTDELTFKGIVYNEMKGAMSSPDQIMARSILKALCPDTTYSNNSGGAPDCIPNLAHDELVKFHKRFYHPSNAFFFTYGDMPLENHLNFIEKKILAHFDYKNPKSDVLNQNKWNNPKELSFSYPLDKNKDHSKKYQICLAWLTADITEIFEVLSLSILEHILLGNPASPLKKALTDSKLGSSLSDGTGFDPDNKDTLFSCGLKDVSKDSSDKIEKIIFDTLNRLVKEGIEKKLIYSAIHQLEFYKKEITNSPYPYGIKLLLTICGNWFHGNNPVKILNLDSELDRLYKEIENGPFFENQIKKYFIENPHRAKIILAPDSKMQENKNIQTEIKLKEIKENLDSTNIKKIKEDTEKLIALQDSKEDISCLPTLLIKDINPLIESLKPSKMYLKYNTESYIQDKAPIFYFASVMGLGGLPPELLPYVPFFCSAFTKMGTSKTSYVEMAKEIDLHTGNISMSPHARIRYNSQGTCIPFISLNGKCLGKNHTRMFNIINELIFQFNFSNTNRLKSLIFEYQAGLESSIIQDGHRLAISLSSKNLTPASSLNEIWHGISQIQTFNRLTKDFSNEKLNDFLEKLTLTGTHILKQNSLKMALIGDKKIVSSALSYSKNLYKTFAKTDTDQLIYLDKTKDIKTVQEGWHTSTAVSFVGSSFKTVSMEHKDSPALSLISKLLKSKFLHREIREKGGAYGGFSLYNTEDGIFSFGSYRDPHIYSTLNTYKKAGDFISSKNFTEEDLKEAKLQICSDIDKPDSPSIAAQKAFYRSIIGLSHEDRTKYKQKILEITKDTIIKTAEKHFTPGITTQSTVVISNKNKLKEANKKLDTPLNLFKI